MLTPIIKSIFLFVCLYYIYYLARKNQQTNKSTNQHNLLYRPNFFFRSPRNNDINMVIIIVDVVDVAVDIPIVIFIDISVLCFCCNSRIRVRDLQDVDDDLAVLTVDTRSVLSQKYIRLYSHNPCYCYLSPPSPPPRTPPPLPSPISNHHHHY